MFNYFQFFTLAAIGSIINEGVYAIIRLTNINFKSPAVIKKCLTLSLKTNFCICLYSE